MVGEIQTKMAMQNLIKFGLAFENHATPLGTIICQNFFTAKEAISIVDALNNDKSPSEIIAMIELLRAEN